VSFLYYGLQFLCTKYHSKIRKMLFVAMTFENCTDDQKSGNILTSPELTLLSDQELTFTMLLVPSSHYSNLNVYKTSVLGHIDTKLGTFSDSPFGSESNSSAIPDNSDVSNTSDDFITHIMCLPAGTYRLVFIASQVENATNSTVYLTEVFLTDSPCSYIALEGNQLLIF